MMIKITQSKKLYLKYENIKNNISNDFFIKKLQNEIKIDLFIIGNEEIENTDQHSKYIFIKNKDKIRKLKSKFDLQIENNIYKCIFLKLLNEKIIKKKFIDKKDLIDKTYSIENTTIIQKENTSLIEIPVKDFYINNFDEKQLIPMESFDNKIIFINYLKNLAQNLNPFEFDSVMCENYPDIFRDIGITNMLYKINKHHTLKKKENYIQYTRDDFDLNTLKIKDRDNYEKWTVYSKQYSLLIYGLSGTGKTSLCLTLGKRPFLIRNINALNNFKEGFHDLPIFDDMRFAHLPVEEIINHLDNEKPSQYNVKHNWKPLPAGIPKINTSNYGPDYVFGKENMQKKEIKRRLIDVQVVKSLFKETLISTPNTILKLK
jgi:hypothetical protein